MFPDQITSVDANGNVTFTSTTVVPIQQLTQDRDNAQEQVNECQIELNAAQTALDQAKATLTSKQAVLDAAQPLQATAIQEAQTSDQISTAPIAAAVQ